MTETIYTQIGVNIVGIPHYVPLRPDNHIGRLTPHRRGQITRAKKLAVTKNQSSE